MTTVDIPLSADVWMESSDPTTNKSAGTHRIRIGERNDAAEIWRTWIKPDFSSIPAGQTFISATLNIMPQADVSSNARTLSVARCLRAVVAAQITWNVYSTGNNWGTAGGSNSSTDYDGATLVGTGTQPASPTLDVMLNYTLTASELQKLYDGTYTNNGLILFVATQTDDAILHYSTENATPSKRPTITITYGGGGFFF